MDERRRSERMCNACIYNIKEGWKMAVEMQEMSNVSPRKGFIKEVDLVDIPGYYKKLSLDIYLPGYVEIGEVCTGVLAGPRGKRLVELINKVVEEKVGDKEYVLIKTVTGYTVHFKVLIKESE